MSVRHVFPLDAEYEIRVGRGGGGFGLEALGGDEEVEITRERRARRRARPRRPAHRRAANSGGAANARRTAIVRKRDAQGVDDLFAVHSPTPGITNLSIVGPKDAAGVGDTPSRRRLFVCSPADVAEDAACAAQIVRQLAQRAYRRPVAADDPAVATLLEFYEQGRAQGSFDTGIQRAVARVLVDPELIFRFEREPADVPVGAIYRVSDVELASRLSFFLWSSIPDEPLLAAAAAGELSRAGRARARGPPHAQQIRRPMRSSRTSHRSGSGCASSIR